MRSVSAAPGEHRKQRQQQKQDRGREPLTVLRQSVLLAPKLRLGSASFYSGIVCAFGKLELRGGRFPSWSLGTKATVKLQFSSILRISSTFNLPQPLGRRPV
jgi:hypothetical protein